MPPIIVIMIDNCLVSLCWDGGAYQEEDWTSQYHYNSYWFGSFGGGVKSGELKNWGQPDSTPSSRILHHLHALGSASASELLFTCKQERNWERKEKFRILLFVQYVCPSRHRKVICKKFPLVPPKHSDKTTYSHVGRKLGFLAILPYAASAGQKVCEEVHHKIDSQSSKLNAAMWLEGILAQYEGWMRATVKFIL